MQELYKVEYIRNYKYNLTKFINLKKLLKY